MKNSIVSLLMVLLLMSACENDPVTTGCERPVFLDENSAIISDPFQVTSAIINGNCLEIEVGAGGCDGDSWEGKLFVFPLVAESLPPQVTVEFSLRDEELCEAYIRRIFSFDLSELYNISESVIVNLRGWDGTLLLEDQNVDISFLQQKWSLLNVNGGLLGVDDRFNKGDITWEFGNETVAIGNSANQDTGVGFAPGSFDYEIKSSDVYADRFELIIDGLNLGPITKLNKDSLVIDQRPVDGLQYVLVSSD